MNQTRTFLLIAWLAVAFLLFLEWNKGPVEPNPAEAAPAAALPEPSAALPEDGAVPDAAAVPA
ncbi:MAG: membrane protein insertase YidC, partial [Pseudomonadota bacterium]